VNGDSHLHFDPGGPGLTLQRALRVEGASDRIRRLPEDGQDAVALAASLDHLALVLLDLLDDDPVVTVERLLGGARRRVPDFRRTFDFGHEECEGPDRQVGRCLGRPTSLHSRRPTSLLRDLRFHAESGPFWTV
jgi:hypothetical protein